MLIKGFVWFCLEETEPNRLPENRCIIDFK